MRHHNLCLNPDKCTFSVKTRKFLGFILSQRSLEMNPEKIKAIDDISSPSTVKEVQCLTGYLAALSRFLSQASDWLLPIFPRNKSQ